MKKLATVIAIALIGTPAFAADMPVKAPLPPPEPVYSWTGFYAGVNAGWGWGKDNTTVNFAGAPIGTPSPLVITFPGGGVFVFAGFAPLLAFQESNHLNGAIGGVQLGYNWQAMSNWILGIEADFQASGQNATGIARQNSFNFSTGAINVATLSQAISHNDALLWFGTVRGRVGYSVWPTVMLYGTGGLAYGRLNESVTASFALTATPTPINTSSPLPAANQAFDASVTKTGWTVGGGIEGAVPNTHVTWRVEYLYMDLGTANYTFSSSALGRITVNTHFTDNIVRVGLNYQFH